MAGGRILCLILCVSAVIISETKTEIPPSASVKYEHSTSPAKHDNQVYSYPGNSHGHSRAGRQVTSAPDTTFGPSGGNKPEQTTASPQTDSLPSSVRGSGSGNKHVKPSAISYLRFEKEHVYYPTYTGNLPDYVNKYKASQSRYRKLLTGLALYNFGMLSQNSTISEWKDYVPSEIETCEFGIRSVEVSYEKVDIGIGSDDVSYGDEDIGIRSDEVPHEEVDTGIGSVAAYEEVDIDCRLITDFIWTVKNQVLPSLPELITGKKVVDALDPRFNGDPIQIKPSMKCYMKWGNSSTSARVKDVDCGLLQMYYDRSKAVTKITTTFLVVATSFVVLLLG